MKTVKGFEYPIEGTSNETVAIFADGTSAHVCPQYGVVAPDGEHAADCEQMTTMGGSCTCGLLDDIDVEAVIAAARTSGKFGLAPVERKAVDPEAERRYDESTARIHRAMGAGWSD